MSLSEQWVSIMTSPSLQMSFLSDGDIFKGLSHLIGELAPDSIIVISFIYKLQITTHGRYS